MSILKIIVGGEGGECLAIASGRATLVLACPLFLRLNVYIAMHFEYM